MRTFLSVLNLRRSLSVCWFAGLLLAGWVSAPPAEAKDEKRKDSAGHEFTLFTPSDLEPGSTNVTYWLVIGIHGDGNNPRANAILEQWLDKGNVIVASPALATGSQSSDLEPERQLQRIFTGLQKEFHLHPKMFLYGFSNGAQIVHRFALRNPKLVIGCVAHSAGVWSDTTGTGATAVPIAISCGEDDSIKIPRTSPMSPIDGCRQFTKHLTTGNFFFKARFWPGVEHTMSPGAHKLSEDCFHLATAGMYEDEYKTVEEDLGTIQQSIDRQRWKEAEQALHQFQTNHPILRSASAPAPAVKPRAADKDKEKEPEGNKPAKVQENEHGWHENDLIKPILNLQRRTFLEEKIQFYQDTIAKGDLTAKPVPAQPNRRPAPPTRPAEPPVRPPGL